MRPLTGQDLLIDRTSDVMVACLAEVRLELHSGQLPFEVIEGDEDAVLAADAEVLGFAAFVQSDDQANFFTAIAYDGKRTTLNRIVSALDAMSQARIEGGQRDGSVPPHTIAALALIGRKATVSQHLAIFRHPRLSEAEARAVIRRAYDAALAHARSQASSSLAH